MSDDLKNRSAQDRLRIDVHEDNEVPQCTNEQNVTCQGLGRAEMGVGVLAADLRNTRVRKFHAADALRPYTEHMLI